MSSVNVFAAKHDLMVKQRTCFPSRFSRNICKSLVISGVFLYIIYMFMSSHPCFQSSKPFSDMLRQHKWRRHRFSAISSPTNISHLFFGIAGASNTWSNKRWYVQAWWRPNVTRGLVFMDKCPVQHLPWPSTFPPFHISEDNSRYKDYNKHAMPFAIRMVHDDTVLLIDNLVDVLSKYDHRKYFYIGMKSECIVSNSINSFDMAFGGAGYALSYPLAKAVAENMDLCIKRYPTVFGSDHILQSCIADLGVSLTQEKGFHQIDFHRDISGFLSAHPQSPFLSLHHLDAVDPIFPSMNQIESVNHLMKAAAADQSRLLQQSICYYKKNNWTFSVSWGYSVQIYEDIFPPSYLYRPLETFIPWRKGATPPYMFNTRVLSTDPCYAPHFFFFASVNENRLMNHIVTSYTRRSPRSLPACVSSGYHSADHISRIRVLSPSKNQGWQVSRRECCDVLQLVGMDSLAVKLRECTNDEILA
ncbi:hypothetical protein Pfo_007012 [Paulownia fortunei]|nr:hypothetical protein Pfo_007012 [Paulownia fortunei]